MNRKQELKNNTEETTTYLQEIIRSIQSENKKSKDHHSLDKKTHGYVPTNSKNIEDHERYLTKLIGSRIHLARKLRKMSQEELAAKINVSNKQLNNYELGKEKISCVKLYHISRILNIDIKELLAESDQCKEVEDYNSYNYEEINISDGYIYGKYLSYISNMQIRLALVNLAKTLSSQCRAQN